MNADCSGEPSIWAPLSRTFCHLQPETRRGALHLAGQVRKGLGGSGGPPSHVVPPVTLCDLFLLRNAEWGKQQEGGISPGWYIYSRPLPGGPGSGCVFLKRKNKHGEHSRGVGRSGTHTARMAGVCARAWARVCPCVQAVLVVTALVQHSGIGRNIPMFQAAQPLDTHRAVFLVYLQLCAHHSGS